MRKRGPPPLLKVPMNPSALIKCFQFAPDMSHQQCPWLFGTVLQTSRSGVPVPQQGDNTPDAIVVECECGECPMELMDGQGLERRYIVLLYEDSGMAKEDIRVVFSQSAIGPKRYGIVNSLRERAFEQKEGLLKGILGPVESGTY